MYLGFLAKHTCIFVFSCNLFGVTYSFILLQPMKLLGYKLGLVSRKYLFSCYSFLSENILSFPSHEYSKYLFCLRIPHAEWAINKNILISLLFIVYLTVCLRKWKPAALALAAMGQMSLDQMFPTSPSNHHRSARPNT